MTDKKKRNLKVYSQSGYRYHEVPAIVLRGVWLKNAGFDIGDYVSVKCEDGRLIIEPDVERAMVLKAVKEFMDTELKALQKRFDAKKENLKMQFVAEREAGYGI